ncbi:hypothetical protein [Streptomyces sp. NBC_00299]|uniref:hypothetical protein n=1 Tax=Streptomyces sp. NBC_00299 TaxID=2975705 RepID=UPI002E27DBB7|nr:hypothetical protein [Streptomyces sp. NBC_00299]
MGAAVTAGTARRTFQLALRRIGAAGIAAHELTRSGGDQDKLLAPWVRRAH